jgi:hypothetical protein
MSTVESPPPGGKYNYGLVIGLFWGLMIEAAVVALGMWLL